MRTVSGALTDSNLLEQVGGHIAITELLIDVPATKNADRYAKTIRALALRRTLIGAGTRITDMGYDLTEDVETVVDRAEQLLYDIGDTLNGGAHAELLIDAVHQWIANLENRATSNTETAITTGLVDLDTKLTGCKPGQLITVCGRPGSGKSLLGVQCGYRVAAHHNRPVLIVSAEMPTEELVDRIVAAEGRIDNQKLRRGLEETDDDWRKVSQAVGSFVGVPLYLFDAPNANLGSIRAEIRRVSAKAGPLALIVVDYLQLLTTAGRSENRQVEVAELSRGLKRLARDMRVPVMALAQVNRNLENRADKRPTLVDLRESGQIEADSDVVIGVYRDEMYNPQSADQGVAELIVLKHRGGPTGTVAVSYLAQFGKFVNMARL